MCCFPGGGGDLSLSGGLSFGDPGADGGRLGGPVCVGGCPWVRSVSAVGGEAGRGWSLLVVMDVFDSRIV
jgi:hypothetical protein